jgi:hypothetical protein
VRDDCVQRLADLEAVSPTIVFAAKDASGDDVVGVKMTVDGAATATELTGAPLAIDPGVHGFTFVVQGASPVVKTLVIREGERDRLEHITFTDLNVPASGVVVRERVPSEGGSSAWNGQKTAAVVVGSAGVVGLLVGTITGALAFGAWSSAQSDCGTNSSVCVNKAQANSDKSSAVTDATVSDVGFIAGGLLLATGVVLYLTAPSHGSSARGALDVVVVPSVASTGGGAQLMGHF